MPEGAGKRFEEETLSALGRPVAGGKPVKPVVPEERIGKSTRLADLPHGEPSYGFVPPALAQHEQVVALLTEIRDAVQDIRSIHFGTADSGV